MDARDLDPSEVMPHNVLAERALIGFALWTSAEDDATFPDLLADLNPEDFWAAETRALWAAIRRVWQARQCIDIILVQHESAVSYSYAAGCMLPWFPSRRHVNHYAQIVRECAARRRQIQDGMQQMQEGLNGSPGPKRPPLGGVPV